MGLESRKIYQERGDERMQKKKKKWAAALKEIK